jgi:hypothetical protein
MLSVIELLTLLHGALAVTFSVNVTVPAAISAALGVYTGVSVVVVLLKVPVPEVVQR